jgi:hypothetical protein
MLEGIGRWLQVAGYDTALDARPSGHRLIAELEPGSRVRRMRAGLACWQAL